MAYHTSEAARVVGFPHSPQDPVQDGLRACGTLLQSGHIAALTIRPPIHGIEMLAPKLSPARRTHKAANMKDAVQGHNPCSIPNHVFSAATTPAKVLPIGWVAHVVHQLLGKPLKLLLRRLAQGNPLRGLAAAPGCLGGELAPERLWQAQAASGGARWAPTWPRMGDSGQRLESHGTPELRP